MCWRGVARVREQVRGWLAEHSVEVAAVVVAWLVAWIVVKVGGELLVWWRARRQAAAATCCADCGGAVEVMTYPPGGDPLACCWACLDRSHKQLEIDGGEPAPWVRLDRPDLMHVASPLVGPLIFTGLLILALADISRSAT